MHKIRAYAYGKILNPQRIIAEWDNLSQKERNDNIKKRKED